MVKKIINVYLIAEGFSGKKVMSKFTIYIFAFIYLLTFLYVGLFYEIKWTENYLPYSILFGGYREVLITSYSSIVSFLFVIMYFFQILWIGAHTKVFYNEITLKLVKIYQVSGLYLYCGFILKRMKDLVVIIFVFLIPLIILYIVKFQIIQINLIIYSFILLYSSFILLCIYDLIYFSTKKADSSSIITILLFLIIPLISFIVRPVIIENYHSVVTLRLLDIFPDVLSIGYQYLLISFGASFSLSKVLFPSIFAVLILLLNFKLSSNTYHRNLD